MKKEGHQRFKQFPTTPHIGYPYVSGDPSHRNYQNLDYSSPLRHFQGHPYAYRGDHSQSRTITHNGSRTDLSRRQISRDYIPIEYVAALQQRLKNIHDHYKQMISDEKQKNAQKSQVIMNLLEQMQATHNEKIQGIRKMIEESENQKKQVGFVDDKMNEIKGNIDELIDQSNVFKIKNKELEKQIAQKARQNEQKESQLEEISQELLEARTELEQFERVNLKNNKLNRQIQQIFNSASTLSSD